MAIANDRSFKPNQGFSPLVPLNNIEFDIQATKSPAESWVELGDRVLGVLGGKRARFKATFPVALWDTMHSANIRYVRSKADSSGRFKEISIQANGFEGYWKLFTTEDGNIIGSKDRMLFVY